MREYMVMVICVWLMVMCMYMVMYVYGLWFGMYQRRSAGQRKDTTMTMMAKKWHWHWQGLNWLGWRSCHKGRTGQRGWREEGQW